MNLGIILHNNMPVVETTLRKIDGGWRLVAEYEADRDLTENLERIANTYKKEK